MSTRAATATEHSGSRQKRLTVVVIISPSEVRSPAGAVMSSHGWELVAVIPGPNQEQLVAYLKRPKE